VLVGDPVVATNVDGRLEVFHRGTDNRLYHAWQRNLDDPSSWSGWESLGGELAGQPAAVKGGGGGTAVFYRGADSRLYYRFFSAAQAKWSDWQAIAFGLTGDPSVAMPGPLTPGGGWRLAVAYRESENHVYFGTQQPQSGPEGPWTFTDIGGLAAGNPVLARIGTWGWMGVFYRGTDSSLQVSDAVLTGS
jgi:hypothetical protein